MVSITNAIDPDGLVALADIAGRCAEQIAVLRRGTTAVLRRHAVADEGAVDYRLASVGTKLAVRTNELRLRAAVMERTQQISLCSLDLFTDHGLGRFAATAVFDPETWRGDYEKWRLAQVVGDLGVMDPRRRARAFATMTVSEMADLVLSYPEEIGAMDGAPAALRYTANWRLIRNEIEQLEVLESELASNRSPIRDMMLDLVEQRRSEYRRWLVENRQILLFDPSGDGRVVEVFGDLADATRVAVVVPGMANSIDNFSDGDGGFRHNAADLYAATENPEIATIAWLGYDSPDNVGAMSRSAADQGAPALQSFLQGIDPGDDRAITVIAHSYGSVLAGTAARTGLEANDLVFVGSPGTTLDTAGDAVLRSDGRVWVGLADGDPITLGINPRELPPWWLPPPLWTIWMAFDMWHGGPEELWYGTNPASDEFGAVRFATDGSNGHSEYFRAEALDNLAMIVEGRYGDVELGG